MKNIIYLLMFLLTVSCSSNKEENVEPEALVENIVTLTEAQLIGADITTGKLERRPISTNLKLSGKIDVPPQNMISVSTPYGGFLKLSKLIPGMYVKKGDVVAIMEDQQYIQLQQDYLTTKSKLFYVENEYQRQKELNQSKASSDKIFQQTEMDYNTQNILLRALEEKLRLINVNPETLNEKNLSRTINIYAPTNAYVSAVKVNIGKYVNPSDVLFELINPDNINLKLKVFERDLNKLSIGQNIKAFNNHSPDKMYVGKIILISQDLAADGSAEVYCEIENADKSLIPGMYMNAEVEIILTNALAINSEAIVSYEGKDYLFISRGPNSYELLEIIKGNSDKGFSVVHEIAGGSSDSLVVVSKGAYSLLMHLKNKAE